MIIPYDFSICDTTTWVLDIESPYKLLQWLQISKKIENTKKILNVGAESHVSVLTSEILEQVFNSNNIIFSDCHHYPFWWL